MSAAGPTLPPSTCSGAMYAGVPRMAPAVVTPPGLAGELPDSEVSGNSPVQDEPSPATGMAGPLSPGTAWASTARARPKSVTTALGTGVGRRTAGAGSGEAPRLPTRMTLPLL